MWGLIAHVVMSLPLALPALQCIYDASPCSDTRARLGVISLSIRGRTLPRSTTAAEFGSFGLDDKVLGFPQIGKLQTDGPLIIPPYCWFSSIDTWDNPSLCAVDTYDLSRDSVRFRSRTYNRPDLVPIAKAIEYAQQRDYRAVLSYCASSELARQFVRDLPPLVFAGDIHVTRTGTGKEHVKMEWGSFEVEKRAGRWVVVSLHPD